jgi:hypothetical protein
MNKNLKTILIIGVLAVGGYYVYNKFFKKTNIENPDLGKTVGGDDNSKIVYEKSKRDIVIQKV